jgi:hypothetical protein
MMGNYDSLDLYNVQFLVSCNAVTLNVTTPTIFPWGKSMVKCGMPTQNWLQVRIILNTGTSK